MPVAKGTMPIQVHGVPMPATASEISSKPPMMRSALSIRPTLTFISAKLRKRLTEGVVLDGSPFHDFNIDSRLHDDLLWIN